jgi:hypothetical protein
LHELSPLFNTCLWSKASHGPRHLSSYDSAWILCCWNFAEWWYLSDIGFTFSYWA